MFKAVRLLSLATLIFLPSLQAQVVGTGIYPLGSYDNKGFDTINLGNLNIHATIPIVNKPGRGMPFIYAIAFNSTVWTLTSLEGTSYFTPVSPQFGFTGVTSQNGSGLFPLVGELTNTSTSEVCQNLDYYAVSYFETNFIYTDVNGTSHPLDFTRDDCYIPARTTGTGLATDGSGYSTDGVYVYKLGIQVFSQRGCEDQTDCSTNDPNGNLITSHQDGTFTDTLGTTALALTGAGTAAQPLQISYPVTEQSDGATTATATVYYKTYTVQTNFQCPSVVDYGATSYDLIDRITLADGVSSYLFSYEPTPGYTGNVTGRLATITLPGGGTIGYSYNGGCAGSGINANGVASGLTRTTTDGSKTYTSAPVNGNATTTTVTDEAGNVSVYNFTSPTQNFLVPTGSAPLQSYYETHRQIYQGSNTSGGNLLDQYTCYNGASANCDGPPITLPISQAEITASYNNGVQAYTTNTYNSAGLLSGSQQSSGSTVETSSTITYNSLGEVVSSTTSDGAGNVISSSSFGYDETTPTATSGIPQHGLPWGVRGNQTSTHVSTGSSTISTSTTYYDTGQPIATTTLNGITQYGYDPTQTFVTSTTLPTPSSGVALATGAAFDSTSGVQLSATGLNSGQTSQYTQYDRLLRPISVSLPNGGGTTYTYSPNQVGIVSTMNAGESTNKQAQLDGYGRVSRVAVLNGQSAAWYQVDYCYDGTGRLQFQSLPYQGNGWSTAKQCSGNGTSYMYDALGRRTSSTNADGTASRKYWGRAVETTDVNNVQRITQYDLLGRISAVCEVSSNSTMPNSGSPTNCGADILGTGFLTSYAYDMANHTTTITQGAQQRVFQADAAGRPIYASEPERGVTTYSYSYNSTGLQVVQTRPSANQTGAATTTKTTQYDSLGRPISITYSDGTPNTSYSYDEASKAGSGFPYSNSNGLLTTMIRGGNSMTQYAYDIMGNVWTTLQCVPGRCGNSAFDVWRGYGYDLVGNRTQEVDGSAGISLNMSFTPAGELSSMSSNWSGATEDNGSVLSNIQNSVNGPTSYTFGNGLTGVQVYDVMGRNGGKFVCSGSTSSSCQGGTQIYGTVASYSGSQMPFMADTVLNTTGNFVYDEFNRLETASFPTAGQAFSYGYDRYGNRTSQTATQGSGPSPQLSFNPANNQTSSNNYDAAGNVISDGFHSYTYDADGNVTAVDGGQTAQYYYDGLNQRVRATLGSSDTDYEFNIDGHRVASWDATTSSPHLLSEWAYWNGQSVATYTDGQIFYTHRDLLGTQRMTTTYSGAPSSTFTSLPFGDNYVNSGGDPDSSHFGLLDHDYESDTEHAAFRQYSSSQGHWMSPDPYSGSYKWTSPQSFNRYSYVQNRPLSAVDPQGLDCETLNVYDPDSNPDSDGTGDDYSNPDGCIAAGGTWTPDPGTGDSGTSDAPFLIVNVVEQAYEPASVAYLAPDPLAVFFFDPFSMYPQQPADSNSFSQVGPALLNGVCRQLCTNAHNACVIAAAQAWGAQNSPASAFDKDNIWPNIFFVITNGTPLPDKKQCDANYQACYAVTCNSPNTAPGH